MRNLYLFTDYFFPINNSTSYYLNGIVDAALASKKFKINIFYIANNVEDAKYKSSKFLNTKKITLPNISKNNLFLRILKFSIISLIFTYYLLVKLRKDDVVMVITNPPFFLPILAFIKKIYKFKTILLIHDVFPQNTVAAKIFSEKNIFYKIILKVFLNSYKKMDFLLVIGRDMKNYVQNNIKLENVLFIPHWSNINEIRVSSNKKTRSKILSNLKLDNSFIFLFSGNIGRVQNLELLINAAKFIKNKKIKLLIIGNGANKKNLINMSNNLKLSNVFFIDEFSYQLQSKFLDICDVGIVSLSKSITGYGVPSKTFSYMAAGKPILFLGSRKSEIHLMLKEDELGWSTASIDPKSIAKLIDGISTNKNINKIGKRVRTVACRKYSPNKIKKKYTNFFYNIKI